MVAGCVQDRNCKEYIAQRHYYEAVDDSAFVILGLVGYDTAYEAENVDAGVEKGIDKCAFFA